MLVRFPLFFVSNSMVLCNWFPEGKVYLVIKGCGFVSVVDPADYVIFIQPLLR